MSGIPNPYFMGGDVFYHNCPHANSSTFANAHPSANRHVRRNPYIIINDIRARHINTPCDYHIAAYSIVVSYVA